jgi:hypothetical protein
MNGAYCSSLLFHERVQWLLYVILHVVCMFQQIAIPDLSWQSDPYTPFEWPSLQWFQFFIIIYIIFFSPDFNLQAVRSCKCLCSMWTVQACIRRLLTSIVTSLLCPLLIIGSTMLCALAVELWALHIT